MAFLAKPLINLINGSRLILIFRWDPLVIILLNKCIKRRTTPTTLIFLPLDVSFFKWSSTQVLSQTLKTKTLITKDYAATRRVIGRYLKILPILLRSSKTWSRTCCKKIPTNVLLSIKLRCTHGFKGKFQAYQKSKMKWVCDLRRYITYTMRRCERNGKRR